MKRYHITLGATTTAGGKVIGASAFMSINGARMALEGDKVSCPACNADGIIQLDGPRVSERFNNRQVALSGDLCMCKCKPPPKLVNTQTCKYQMVDPQAASAGAAGSADGAPAGAAKPAGRYPGDVLPLRLLHPRTQAPLASLDYRLELQGQVIEGTTDDQGCTRPLNADERASLLAWHVGDISVP